MDCAHTFVFQHSLVCMIKRIPAPKKILNPPVFTQSAAPAQQTLAAQTVDVNVIKDY